MADHAEPYAESVAPECPGCYRPIHPGECLPRWPEPMASFDKPIPPEELVRLAGALTRMARAMPVKNSTYAQGQADGLLMAAGMVESMIRGEPTDDDLPVPRDGMKRVVRSYAEELWGAHIDGQADG
jgi:hypothetical protein